MHEKKINLSLCMIVKNEEQYLRECLESVKEIVDEIIIVDTGSTDSTLKIAEEFGAQIYHFKWINDFSAARNFSLSKCSGAWVLYLDADERLNPQSVNVVLNQIKSSQKKAIRCYVKNLDDYNGSTHSMKYPRLFFYDKELVFTGRVHEQIGNSLNELNYEILDSDIEIIHIGYNISKNEKIEKAKRNLLLLLHEYYSKPTGYYAFQLGQTYNVLEDFENAKHYTKLSINDPDLPEIYKYHAHVYLGTRALNEHDINLAFDSVYSAFKLDIQQPILFLLASKVYFRQGRFTDSETFAKRAWDLNQELILSKNKSTLDIILEENELIYYGLNLSLRRGNKIYIKFYYDELKNLLAKNSESYLIQLSALSKIINQSPIDNKEQKVFAEFISQKNLDFCLSILSKYHSKEKVLNILSEIKEKFIDNPQFLNAYALSLSENKKPEEAELIWEKLLSINKYEPSSLFYLISFYVSIKRFEKIPNVFKLIEKNFSNIPEVTSRLIIIKQKLGALNLINNN